MERQKDNAAFLNRLAFDVATMPKLGDVAEKNAISRDALYKIRQRPDFQEMVQQHNETFMRETAQALQAKVPAAIDALMNVIDDKDSPKTAIVQAAKAIMDYSCSFRDAADVDDRLRELERRVSD